MTVDRRSMYRIIMLMACLWASATTGCGKPGFVGLRPDNPPIVRKGFSLFANYVEVDTLTPTFRWQPLAIEPESQSSQHPPIRIEKVTYELRIWRTVPDGYGKLVYAREDLTTTEHKLERPLAPGTRYLWSVRAHFHIDSRCRTTEWTLAGYLLRSETVPNGSCLRFKTPSEIKRLN